MINDLFLQTARDPQLKRNAAVKTGSFTGCGGVRGVVQRRERERERERDDDNDDDDDTLLLKDKDLSHRMAFFFF